MNLLKHLVMVDDDPDDIEIMENAIAKVGWDVQFSSFFSGANLLEYIRKDASFQPNLVLLDHNMPLLNGSELVDKLLTLYCSSPLHIVVFTSGMSSTWKTYFHSLGILCCITKPCSIIESLQLVTHLKAAVECEDWSLLEY